MTKEKILAMIERLFKLLDEIEEKETQEENNLVEFMGEDEQGNGIYRFK